MRPRVNTSKSWKSPTSGARNDPTSQSCIPGSKLDLSRRASPFLPPTCERGGKSALMNGRSWGDAAFPLVSFAREARPLTPNPSPRRREGNRTRASAYIPSSPLREGGARRAGEGAGAAADRISGTAARPQDRPFNSAPWPPVRRGDKRAICPRREARRLYARLFITPPVRSLLVSSRFDCESSRSRLKKSIRALLTLPQREALCFGCRVDHEPRRER
jgi:hypothetical protein